MTDLTQTEAGVLAYRWLRGDAAPDEVAQLAAHCRTRLTALHRDGHSRDRVDLAVALGAELGLRAGPGGIQSGTGIDGVASVRLAKLAGYPDEILA